MSVYRGVVLLRSTVDPDTLYAVRVHRKPFSPDRHCDTLHVKNLWISKDPTGKILRVIDLSGNNTYYLAKDCQQIL